MSFEKEIRKLAKRQRKRNEAFLKRWEEYEFDSDDTVMDFNASDIKIKTGTQKVFGSYKEYEKYKDTQTNRRFIRKNSDFMRDAPETSINFSNNSEARKHYVKRKLEVTEHFRVFVDKLFNEMTWSDVVDSLSSE